jgi:CRP-like cAMP-binding protein
MVNLTQVIIGVKNLLSSFTFLNFTMQTHRLFEVLFSMNPLPKELTNEANRKDLMEYINSKIGFSHHSHRQLLLNPGQIADHIYFVENGMVRGYYDDELKEKEYTICLWDEQTIITEPQSFLKRTPSQLYIEVMPGSRLLSISRQQLSDIIDAFPYAEIFTRCLMLQYVSYHTKRTHDLISLSAWERYLDLLQRHPKIEQKISKEIIASYLGITPQSLSRLIKDNGHP